MEAHAFGVAKIGVKEVFDPVSVVKEFLRIGSGCDIDVVDQSERAYRAGAHAETSFHPRRAGKTQLALMKKMFKGMDVQVFVTLEADQIMPVALVIAEKQVLAVGGVYVLPVCKGFLDGKKGRMVMDLVAYPVFL